MLIFHYIPERSGYKFIGWNSKKMAPEKLHKFILERLGYRQQKEFDRDMLIKDCDYYKYLTLYAVWVKILRLMTQMTR